MREVQARPGAQLEHPPTGERQQCTPARRHPTTLAQRHKRVVDPRFDMRPHAGTLPAVDVDRHSRTLDAGHVPPIARRGHPNQVAPSGHAPRTSHATAFRAKRSRGPRRTTRSSGAKRQTHRDRVTQRVWREAAAHPGPGGATAQCRACHAGPNVRPLMRRTARARSRAVGQGRVRSDRALPGCAARRATTRHSTRGRARHVTPSPQQRMTAMISSVRGGSAGWRAALALWTCGEAARHSGRRAAATERIERRGNGHGVSSRLRSGRRPLPTTRDLAERHRSPRQQS